MSVCVSLSLSSGIVGSVIGITSIIGTTTARTTLLPPPRRPLLIVPTMVRCSSSIHDGNQNLLLPIVILVYTIAYTTTITTTSTIATIALQSSR